MLDIEHEIHAIEDMALKLRLKIVQLRIAVKESDYIDHEAVEDAISSALEEAEFECLEGV
jgi:hypothetical protein